MYPSITEIEAIYAKRDKDIAALGKKETITMDDLAGLDRLGRFQVVSCLWKKCSKEVRHALANDSHHSVRSAALLETCKLH